MAASDSIPTKLGPPVLTEVQAKALSTLKSIARSNASAGTRTTSEVADAVRISLPALKLAAGSASATGDIRGARYVAGQAKAFADDLRSALKNGAGQPADAEAPSQEQIKTMTKQLKLLLVKARIALAGPQARYLDGASRQSAETAMRSTEASLKALEAQIGGVGKVGVDVKV